MGAPERDATDSGRVLTLVLPDWQSVDTVLRSSLPFALWSVGAQPLLHHWLDHAVDAGFRRVRLLVSDRPAEVRKAMEAAQLWPVRWDVVPRSRTEAPPPELPDAEYLDHLPGQPAPQSAPSDGWGLLRHWFGLREAWFASVDGEHMEAFRTLAIGRFCSIHPSAELRMPVWIEDYAQIGPGCVVGPNVNVGRGAVLEGPSRIKNAVITDHTYLSGHTELRDSYLDGGLLLNLRHGARVTGLDQIVADHLRETGTRTTTFGERVSAALLYAAFTVADRVLPGRARALQPWTTFDGVKMADGHGPLWRRRRPWLLHVMQGKLRLVGVLPRTQSQFEHLSPDWQELLREATAGVLAYSDLHGSHSPDDELEAIHAVYQVSNSDEQIRNTVRENARRLFATRP